MADSLLNGFRALDLTDQKGLVCGQILGSLGVEVIQVEKPGGNPVRNIPPFFHNIPDPEKSLYWFAFNTDKKSITLNLDTEQGRDLFRKLAEKADFVLESLTPGYLEGLGLGYKDLRRVNKRIIMTSITHFGGKGPYSQYKGSELIDSAMSGVLYNTGQPDMPPVKEALDALYFHAGAAAALGSLIAHYHRELAGEGQQVDISIQEVATSRTPLVLLPWLFDRRLVKRQGVMGQTGLYPFPWVWRCSDGYVFWFFLGGRTGAPANRALTEWIDEDGMENPLRNIANWEEMDRASLSGETLETFRTTIAAFFLKHTKKEIESEGLKRGLNAVIASDPADVINNRQFAARDYWKQIDHPGLGTSIIYPRHFFLSNLTENYTIREAPGIGRNNEDIYGKELGFSSIEIDALRKASVI